MENLNNRSPDLIFGKSYFIDETTKPGKKILKRLKSDGSSKTVNLKKLEITAFFKSHSPFQDKYTEHTTNESGKNLKNLRERLDPSAGEEKKSQKTEEVVGSLFSFAPTERSSIETSENNSESDPSQIKSKKNETTSATPSPAAEEKTEQEIIQTPERERSPSGSQSPASKQEETDKANTSSPISSKTVGAVPDPEKKLAVVDKVIIRAVFNGAQETLAFQQQELPPSRKFSRITVEATKNDKFSIELAKKSEEIHKYTIDRRLGKGAFGLVMRLVKETDVLGKVKHKAVKLSKNRKEIERGYLITNELMKDDSGKQVKKVPGLIKGYEAIAGGATVMTFYDKGSAMPITEMVYSILYERLTPIEAVSMLMQRAIKEEHL